VVWFPIRRCWFPIRLCCACRIIENRNSRIVNCISVEKRKHSSPSDRWRLARRSDALRSRVDLLSTSPPSQDAGLLAHEVAAEVVP